MARHITHNIQPSRKTATLAPPQTKHAKHSPLQDALQHKASRIDVKAAPAIQRPVREPKSVEQTEKHRKPRETVSAAGIFKHKSKPNAREKKHRRRRSPTPEPDLLLELKDGIEEARNTMLSNTEATFGDVHAAFTSQLAESRAADLTFFENADRITRILSAPLAEEYVEAFFNRDGIRVSETFTIGDRVEKFRRLVEKEEMQLGEYWKQWDEVQNEYLGLGVEVFGEKGFGEDGKGVKRAKEGERGWKREMELLEVEYETRIQELDEEVGGIKGEFLKIMKASEKELDLVAKKEQARLLQAIIQE